MIHSSQLGNLRKEFESKMCETVELVNEQTSCHSVIAESLIEVKVSLLLRYSLTYGGNGVYNSITVAVSSS